MIEVKTHRLCWQVSWGTFLLLFLASCAPAVDFTGSAKSRAAHEAIQSSIDVLNLENSLLKEANIERRNAAPFYLKLQESLEEAGSVTASDLSEDQIALMHEAASSAFVELARPLELRWLSPSRVASWEAQLLLGQPTDEDRVQRLALMLQSILHHLDLIENGQMAMNTVHRALHAYDQMLTIMRFVLDAEQLEQLSLSYEVLKRENQRVLEATWAEEDGSPLTYAFVALRLEQIENEARANIEEEKRQQPEMLFEATPMRD